MSEWKTIDSAPKDGTAILAAYDFKDGSFGQVVVMWTRGDEVYPWKVMFGDNAIPTGRIPYWRKLPEPPK